MPRQLSHGERLAVVEVELRAVRADITEMKADIKVLVAAHERQAGAKRLWSWLVTAAGALGGFWAGSHHGS